MAAATDQLTAVLSMWRQWDLTPPLEAIPVLGAVWAEGSGHRLYTLANNPALCARLRHRSTSTVAGGFAREIAAWTHAANRGLGPQIAYVANAEEIVVCERLCPEEKPICAQKLGALARAIHQLPKTAYRLDLYQVINDYLQRVPAVTKPKWQLIVDDHRVTQALRCLEQDTPRLCHNDLTAGNLLYKQEQLVAIDWEYAAMGSRYFDVAIAMEPLPLESQDAFLSAVFDEQPDSDLVAAGKLIARLCTLLWQQCFDTDSLIEASLWPAQNKAI